ncbi:MAG: pyruvate:ferredoxin (flavodoxin) oxidoreductase [Nitriliruptoraceae bacterium]|nr:pyruvate:ferredoxin (flavodoxin) oxidoreductase [Nitriliruptoraceae bacterium]
MSPQPSTATALATATRAVIDGNEAVARVAYACSETIAIYPITPASPMGEAADAWSSAGRPNLWGAVPAVVEMQSEAGAAGALHGAVTTGSLGTTFTSSQGLLLMLPNMFKIAGELTPAVLHVAARTIATHALSIFGDHSDVMAARTTGWTMLASNSPQEAHDLAAVAHAATLATRIPIMHFFDGFRTSHEMNEVTLLGDDDLASLIEDDDVIAHRGRGLDPDQPQLRGTAQNPDVFFQAREACNPFHDAVPGAVQHVMDRLAARTGRAYRLVEYHGAPDAERVVVLMGSGAGAVRETIDHLLAQGEKVGMVVIRLFRPFPVEAFLQALPATVGHVAVLDRTKEPGSVGEPLLTDIVTVLADAHATGARPAMPRTIGGRYGLSSKEFTPAMVASVFAELERDAPRRRFTVGIVDDVTHLSLDIDRSFVLPRREGDLSVVFHGLGSDGTVGAAKQVAQIVAERTGRKVQAYFVYDSKKSGAVTASHLRVSDEEITSTYLVDAADVVVVNQFGLLEKLDVLREVKPGGTVLLNAPFGADEAYDRLPAEVQRMIVDRGLDLYVIDAYRLARQAGLGGRINSVMQMAFYRVTGVLDADTALEAMGDAIRTAYGKRGEEVVTKNLDVIRRAVDEVAQAPVGSTVTTSWQRPGALERALELTASEPGDVPELFERVTARLMAGEGDLLPVSALPVDGTFPTGTARYEKRSIATEVPTWDPDICIDCGKCAIVCPHAAIQIKVFDPSEIDDAPDHFLSKPFKDRNLTDHLITVQVAPDDCTGCGVCVESCPAVSRSDVGHKAIDMTPIDEVLQTERERYRAFDAIPYLDRTKVRHDTVKHSQTLQPLFEFSGACAGCGETPYLKLMTQLFGDRSVVANATGCSSIYGGNLPTTPWGTDAAGRGPAWSNSLFEDNAEFGLGMRLAIDEVRAVAIHLLLELAGELGDELVTELATATQLDEVAIAAQRGRVEELRRRLQDVDGARAPQARHLAAIAHTLVRRDVWIVGGDGWAYDIGFGGVDHVLASGEDVNLLVLDTEVYSNTGGQASKATARGAVAKFAAAGKSTPKKDLGAFAMQYGHVYVARIAIGANEQQTVKAFREAEAWPGPSLLLAYSTCIAHGVDMRQSMTRMDLAVKTGYWPLLRYHPGEAEDAQPLKLDSKAPTESIDAFLRTEGRYAVLERSDPDRAAALRALAQSDVDERWRYYEQLAGLTRTQPSPDVPSIDEAPTSDEGEQA